MQFTADFKLGHYMKVPPRPMFWCQIVATMIAGTVQLAVQAWCVFLSDSYFFWTLEPLSYFLRYPTPSLSYSRAPYFPRDYLLGELRDPD